MGRVASAELPRQCGEVPPRHSELNSKQAHGFVAIGYDLAHGIRCGLVTSSVTRVLKCRTTIAHLIVGRFLDMMCKMEVQHCKSSDFERQN